MLNNTFDKYLVPLVASPFYGVDCTNNPVIHFGSIGNIAANSTSRRQFKAFDFQINRMLIGRASPFHRHSPFWITEDGIFFAADIFWSSQHITRW
jgi:hypothetical protein